MTERNTQREETQSINYEPKNLALWKAVKQLGNLKRDGSDEIDPITVMKMVDTELTKAREEGYADGVVSYTESTAINDIGVTLLKVEQIRSEAVKSYRQELRKKVEGMKEDVLKLARKTDYADRTEYDYCAEKLEDLLTIISE